MPMGIKTAPSWFQRFIDKTLADLAAKNILNVYMDDILVFSKNLNEHFYDVKSVINRLINKSLKASGDKSYLITRQIEFLGQIISDGIVRAHPKRAE